MKKYFCSADIHSFFEEWMISLKSVGFDINNSEHIIIICGDLFDRGDETNSCIHFVKKLLHDNRLIYIRGNHEDLLVKCFQELKQGKMGHHHISNGTVKTISHVMNCSEYDILCHAYDSIELNNAEVELMSIVDKSVDYFELGDKVFVHGWIPTTPDDSNHEIVPENWRDGDWNQARWECGFDCWRCKLVPPEGETVVCGHWHASYGWSQFRGKTEWGPDAEFISFIDDKIIAIDACTAYTHMVNVVVFDDKGNVI